MEEQKSVFLAMRSGPVRECCWRALEDKGFRVIPAPLRTEAFLKEIREQQPDVALMEILTTALDFFGILRQARQEGMKCRFFTTTSVPPFSVVDELEALGNRGNFAMPLNFALMAEQLAICSGSTPRKTPGNPDPLGPDGIEKA